MVAVVLIAVALGGIALLVTSGRTRPLPTARNWLDECGLAGVPTGVVVIGLVACGIVIGGTVAIVVPIPVLAPLAAVAGIAIPLAALDASRSRRRVLAESRWPDILDAIRMALRSGVPLHAALDAADAQLPAEWRGSWRSAIAGLANGASVASTVRELQRQRADPLTDRVGESIIVAHEMGGTELPRVLEELGRGIRDELRVRREATARQSWVRHAARLGSAAPWIVVIMLGSRPENRAAFSSAAGVSLLVACAGATLVAYTVMTAMGKLPEKRRWVTDD